MIPVMLQISYSYFHSDEGKYKELIEDFAVHPLAWVTLWPCFICLLTCLHCSRQWLNRQPETVWRLNIVFVEFFTAAFITICYHQFVLQTPQLFHASNFGSSTILYAFVGVCTDPPALLLFINLALLPMPVVIAYQNNQKDVTIHLLANIYCQISLALGIASYFLLQNRRAFLLELDLELQHAAATEEAEEEVRESSRRQQMAHFTAVKSIAHDLR